MQSLEVALPNLSRFPHLLAMHQDKKAPSRVHVPDNTKFRQAGKINCRNSLKKMASKHQIVVRLYESARART